MDIIWDMSGPQIIGGVLRCRVPVTGGVTKCDVVGIPLRRGEPDIMTQDRAARGSTSRARSTRRRARTKEDTEYEAFKANMLSFEPLVGVGLEEQCEPCGCSTASGWHVSFPVRAGLRQFHERRLQSAAYCGRDRQSVGAGAATSDYYPNGFGADQFGFGARLPGKSPVRAHVGLRRRSQVLRHAAAVAALVAPVALLAQAPNPIPASVPLAADAPFTVAVNTSTIEGAPVYVADNGPAGAGFTVINGGVRNLANGGAHAATNAETQLLVVGTPNVRLLFTVAEGLYRVVAKRSAGIRTPADLRGKRVSVPRDTSAHYYLVRTLVTAGLTEADVTLVDLPRDGMAAGVAAGRADALVMWEPEAEKGVAALGQDVTIFQDNRMYREFFSLYASTEVLGNPKRRQELVGFVRALLAATDEVKRRPEPHFPLDRQDGQPVRGLGDAELAASRVSGRAAERAAGRDGRGRALGGAQPEARAALASRASRVHRHAASWPRRARRPRADAARTAPAAPPACG